MTTLKNKILMFYPVEHDPQSTILMEEILNKGGVPLFLPFKLENDNVISRFGFDYTGDRPKITIDDELENIKVVYTRNIAISLPYSSPPYNSRFEYAAWQAKFIKENEKIYFMNSLLNYYEREGAIIANSIYKFLHHNSKSQFFHYLKNEGLNVPESFATNDIRYLQERFENAKLIMKSACGVGATRRLAKELLTDGDSLLRCPAFFQEEIESSTIRVHTVGNKVVLALKIFAQDIDSRSDTSGFEIINLTEEQEYQINKANELIGLHFSAWDVIVSKDDKLWLIDCNPGPYIFWIGEYFTRLYMAELAKYFVKYAETGSIEEANEVVEKVDAMVGRVFKIEKEVMHHIFETLHEWKAPMRQRY